MGEQILVQGRPAHAFLIIRWGRAQAKLAIDGKPDLPVHEFRLGEFILFKELFRGAPSPFSVVAASDVEAFAMPLEDLLALLAEDTRLGQEIEKLVALREGRASQVLADAHVAAANGNASEDRMEILKQMFRS
jgi:CRP-like cAMP-binding protein